MIQSMTGYGRAEGSLKGHTLMVEIRAVNHRYSNIAVRLPHILRQCEESVKKKIQAQLERGRIDLSVTINESTDSSTQIKPNLEAATSYYEAIKKLKDSLHLTGEIDIALVSQCKEIITVSGSDEPTFDLKPLLNKTIGRAMHDLEKMRKEEGRTLSIDLNNRLKTLSKQLSVVKGQEKEVVLSRQRRLQKRVSELTSGLEIDPIRLAQEIDIIAECSDISEERTRLKAHFDQFKLMLRKRGPVGRSLDFLLQEMFREVNTLSAKSGDQTISMAVVAMKSEFEKMKEQVQNVA